MSIKREKTEYSLQSIGVDKRDKAETFFSNLVNISARILQNRVVRGVYGCLINE